jgi:antitoxin VapB
VYPFSQLDSHSQVYIYSVYIQKVVMMMQTAALFKNGGSQAVRLPKEFRFDGDEVFIKKTAEGVLLIPKEEHIALMWQAWVENLSKFDEPIVIERGGAPQEREELDELFP